MPPKPTSLAIRADASDTIGTGHIMRMIALGQAVKRRGGDVHFITAACSDFLSERLRAEGFGETRVSPESIGDHSDALSTKTLCEELGSGWLVVDGYQFTEVYHLNCVSDSTRLLVLDDFGHCENWHCQTLLNQNLNVTNPTGKLPQTLLQGVRFSLLREEFLDKPPKPRKKGPVEKLLITLGGSDPQNVTAWVLKQLDGIVPSNVEVRVIIGPCNSHRSELLESSYSFPIEWRTNVQDMPREYLWADAIISAGGSSCWEWLYYRLRGCIVTLTENQVASVAEIERQRIALCLGWPDEADRSDVLRSWLQDPGAAIDSEKSSTLIDGRGADRVIAALDGTQCLIRHADFDRDARFTFDLANEPTVRAAGFSTDEIPRENHVAWLKNHLAAETTHLFVIEHLDGRSVGTLRFMKREAGWEIGIAIVPDGRGKGYADLGIIAGMNELARTHGIQHYLAVIRPENSGSRKLFERLGFHLDSADEQSTHWSYHQPL